MKPSSVAARWRVPASCGCSRWRTPSTAACPGRRLFAPAIRLAEDGFPVGQRLHTLLKTDPHLRKDPGRPYFYDRDGQPHWLSVTILRNPELAGVLRRIASEGSQALYDRRDRAGGRRQGAAASGQPRPAEHGRHGSLPAAAAHSPVQHLSPGKSGTPTGVPDLRLSPAQLGGDRHLPRFSAS
jgi:hypothetical protein